MVNQATDQFSSTTNNNSAYLILNVNFLFFGEIANAINEHNEHIRRQAIEEYNEFLKTEAKDESEDESEDG